MKTFLVTGGAGFIGSHVVDSLLKRGERVVVIDDFNDYYSPEQKRTNISAHLQNPYFKLYEADIRRQGIFDEIFNSQQIHGVIHLAARAGVRPSLENPQLYWDVNVMGSLQLLEAMRKNSVPQLVFASSSSVYGNRTDGPFKETDNTDKQVSPYGASKKALEIPAHTYSHLYGIKATGLRFFTVYGPRNRPDMACYLFIKAISSEETIVQYGDGSTGRDYTFIDDIVDGILKALDNPFPYEVFNLGNTHPVLLKDLIRTIEVVTKRSANRITEERHQADVEFTYADVSKAKKILQWSPSTGLTDGVSQLVNWYNNYQNTKDHPLQNVQY